MNSLSKAAADLGRKGGASRSPAKQAASRANGRKRKRKPTKITFREGDRVKLGGMSWTSMGTVTIIHPGAMGVRIDDGTRMSLSIVPAEVSDAA